jgi:fumarylacetoacetate (FAA) hydrolase
MRLAHVRERGAATGTPWRLVAARERPDPAAGEPARWLDLEVVRRRAIREDPALAHNSAVFRQRVTTLDDHLARGLRVAALRDLFEGFRPGGDEDEASLDAGELEFGPPVLRPPAIRDFYAFEVHVATAWARRGGEVPEAWYRLPVFYFGNTSELRGPEQPVWAPRGSLELDYELEIGALVDLAIVDADAERAEEAIGGFTILNDWSARDLQRDETTVRLGPAKGKDFAISIGPWLVTPDELPPAVDGAKAPDLAMTATVNGVETSRGTWADVRYSFGEMLARASADARIRPGELLGSGTVGTGCLMESRDRTIGRWLEPGDEVVLEVERLGRLRSPIVARPAERR